MSADTLRRTITPSGYGWAWEVIGGMDPFAARSGRAWTFRRAEIDSALALARIADDMNKRAKP